MTPNIEHIRLWVEALRSGKYQKGYGALRKHQPTRIEHCAVGVAAEISGCFETSGRIYGATAKWLGIPDNANGIDKVIGWNDIEHLTFEQIADKIERGDLTNV